MSRAASPVLGGAFLFIAENIVYLQGQITLTKKFPNMNNLIIKRSQLVEAQFTGTPAAGKKYQLLENQGVFATGNCKLCPGIYCGFLSGPLF